MDTIEKVNGFFNSLGFKLGLIAFLSLLLLIPAAMIQDLIREREQRRNETIIEVSSIWGNSQVINGPVLTVPYEITEKRADGQLITRVNYAHFLPDNLNIEGRMIPELRKRGIYSVVTYSAQIRVTGTFKPETASPVEGLNFDSPANAFVEIGIPDMRGINKDIVVKWNDSEAGVIPGMKTTDVASSGVHAPVQFSRGNVYNFSFDLDLNGSSSLNFIPLGKVTNVNLTSTWADPSFSGAFLPDERKIDEKGFTASWNVLQLNRNFPQFWLNDDYEVTQSAFGVELITPVDHYQKSERSAKYAILFIGLTFLIFFFAEIMTKTRIHPVLYLLTGFAVVVFYSLLTALSEHISFNIAYIVAALTITSMVGLFARSLYKNSRVTLVIISSMVILYTFLFVILQLADYSLLIGNIGLVIILAVVMYFARKIDWYSR